MISDHATQLSGFGLRCCPIFVAAKAIHVKFGVFAVENGPGPSRITKAGP